MAQQDQVTQLRNTFRSEPWICLRKNGCFLSLAAVSTLERALFLIHGPKRAQLLFAEDFFNCFKGHKLTKHPFSQRHAGQDSLKHKRKWSLFYTHPALALWGIGAAALQ